MCARVFAFVFAVVVVCDSGCGVLSLGSIGIRGSIVF